MEVVAGVLACDGWIGGGRVLGFADRTTVLELGLLGCEALLDVVAVAVLDIVVLDADHNVDVAPGEPLYVGWVGRKCDGGFGEPHSRQRSAHSHTKYV